MFIFKCDLGDQSTPATCDHQRNVMLSETTNVSNRPAPICSCHTKCKYQKPININWEVDA